MLLAEDPLDLLLDRLRALPAGDRRAVLARLDAAERHRVEKALRAPPVEPAPLYAADIAERIAASASDPSMTAAGREALARVAGRAGGEPEPTPVAGPTPSLLGRLGGVLRGR